jgi:hypothetical protein
MSDLELSRNGPRKRSTSKTRKKPKRFFDDTLPSEDEDDTEIEIGCGEPDDQT